MALTNGTDGTRCNNRFYQHFVPIRDRWQHDFNCSLDKSEWTWMLITPCTPHLGAGGLLGEREHPCKWDYVVVQPTSGLIGEGCIIYPELRLSACTGLSTLNAFGVTIWIKV